jgi:two-component system, NarL family, sensor histidine kinase DegS
MELPQQQFFDDPKVEIVELLTSRLSSIKQKIAEIKQQVEQTDLMVQREQERNTDLAGELQIIQANIDSTPREDIRDKYNEALDARFRLATMRGQLEKFQNHFEYMEQEQQLLTQVLGSLEGVDVTAIEDYTDEDSSDAKGIINIVRIVQAQEEERQRLARQMHDGPAQSLTNFILQAEICQRLFNRNPERAGEELDNLKTAASITFQKVRDFIFDLRPMMLDDLGVVPTIRRYTDTMRDKNDIEVDLEIVGEERRLESHREVLLFRGVQELIAHARDYANAAHIWVQLDISGKMVKASVRDNGRSFDVENIDESNQQDARLQGLATLKEKFELVGGNMTASSSDSDGSTIRLALPAEN